MNERTFLKNIVLTGMFLLLSLLLTGQNKKQAVEKENKTDKQQLLALEYSW